MASAPQPPPVVRIEKIGVPPACTSARLDAVTNGHQRLLTMVGGPDGKPAFALVTGLQVTG